MKYKNTVQVYKNVEVSDNAGGTETTATLILTLRVRVIPITGARAVEFGEVIDGKPYELIGRYRGDLEDFSLDDPSVIKEYWFVFRNREFTLHSLQIDREERKFFTIQGWEKA